jgi:hypothetical protein
MFRIVYVERIENYNHWTINLVRFETRRMQSPFFGARLGWAISSRGRCTPSTHQTLSTAT